MKTPPVITHLGVTTRNQHIAMWIATKLNVRQGYNLAYYLKVPIGNDNYTALCLWVQYQSMLVPKKYHTTLELLKGFKDLIPQYKFKGD